MPDAPRRPARPGRRRAQAHDASRAPRTHRSGSARQRPGEQRGGVHDGGCVVAAGPSLHGIIVARQDRAADMVAIFDRSARHDQRHTAGQPAQLGAEDVTRGGASTSRTRSRGRGEWFSLHRREGRYESSRRRRHAALSVHPRRTRVPEGPPPPRVRQRTPPRPVPARDARRLGRMVARGDAAGKGRRRDAPVDPATRPEVADTGFPLAPRDSGVQRVASRLRFGRAYRLRVRAVDLSGMSIPDDQLDEATSAISRRTSAGSRSPPRP